MAQFMKSRNADQCRSHHHKLLEYHSTPENIISHFETHVFSRVKQLEILNQRQYSSKPKDFTPKAQEKPFCLKEVINGVIKIEIDAKKVAVFRL